VAKIGVWGLKIGPAQLLEPKSWLPKGGRSLMHWQSPVLLKKRSSCRGNPDDCVPVRAHSRDEPAFVCLLPDRKLRTRSVPSFYHLIIAPLFAGDVLQQIDDQGFNGVGRKVTSKPRW